MDEFIFNKINEYNSIIILRHSKPDLDALGSQMGLYYFLKDNFSSKNIYVCGDESEKFGFIGKMNDVDDEIFKKSLVFILDVSVSYMVCDDRYKLSPCVIVIDHHNNECDLSDNWYCDPTRAACAEYLAYMFLNSNLKISNDCATALYGGIITDSGRFMYGNRLDRTLSISAKLVELGADFKYIYDNLYVETLLERQMKAFFSNRYLLSSHNVAYLINDKDVMLKYSDVEFNNISRGMLSVMAGIKEIPIWLNFTYDITKDKYIGEFRSRNIKIVDIAKKWGGGGHNLACGATINTLNDIKLVIKDFDDLIINN